MIFGDRREGHFLTLVVSSWHQNFLARQYYARGVVMSDVDREELDKLYVARGWLSGEMINRKLQWLLEDLNDLVFVRDHLKVIERDYVIRKVSRFLEEERKE